MNKLFEETKYTIPVKSIISSFIREYDISKANINILFKYNVIDKDTYDTLYNMDRMTRQITVGNMQKDYNVTKVLQSGIKEAKRVFFESNNIDSSDILSIKNDAVFIINKIPKHTKFDNIEFVNKNIYTSYYNLNNMEFYYYYDIITNTEVLDVKGIGDYNIKLHENYIIEFLKVCFQSAQTDTIQSTLDLVTSFYNSYIQLALDVNYYRQLNAESMFVLKPISNYHCYKMHSLNDANKNDIDISCNLNLIRELHQIYSELYFSRK